jgi:hypothetical protein
MTNPLEQHLEIYQIVKEAFKVVQRIFDQRKNPVSNTEFYGKSQDEAKEMLSRAEKQLSDLVAFALFAAFERTLRDHLSNSLGSIQSSHTTPAELSRQLHEYLIGGVDNWRVDNIIDLFSPPVQDQDINNAKNIRIFRHHVAHGATPPTSIPPQTIHKQLTEFLKNAGLV